MSAARDAAKSCSGLAASSHASAATHRKSRPPPHLRPPPKRTKHDPRRAHPCVVQAAARSQRRARRQAARRRHAHAGMAARGRVMEIHSLEDIRREDDGRLVWRFMVTGDISGAPHNPHMISANRIWEVTTDATAPVVIDDAYAPRAPDVVP